ncbi:MAG TPA: cytochrome-c oxidase, cbb3-type subunit III [Rhizobiales bacterium]|nr:cytochrome-c oxidase, cbb3-type subunit III [Hyphomicrobiales bacterium]
MGTKKVDEVTGVETTGHVWDGIAELNNPLPRWWVWTFWATVIWAIGYWVVYPAWPLLNSYTPGVFGYSERKVIVEDMAKLNAARAQSAKKLLGASLDDIKNNPDLLNFARAMAKPAFGDNCAACHGTGASGSKGFPNLNDDDWLWGGTLDDIYTTIRVGARDKHEDTRTNDMPAFGKDEILDKKQITDVAGYVLSLSGGKLDGADVAAGKAVFEENCTSCHGENAKGQTELGAPNLTDNIWLYGGDAATVIETITNARRGKMPTWEGRLSPALIKALAVYVHTLGGGK